MNIQLLYHNVALIKALSYNQHW